MKYYIVAGEASGDLHGSNLVKELKKQDSKAIIRGWGGDLMKAEGVNLVKHYRETAFMGFLEVVKNLRTIFSLIDFCKKDIEAFKPDALILIDYPGFNLRLAAFARAKGLKVFYYISPKVWAWKEGRVKQIKANVDKMFVILPFEKTFYAKHNYDVEFVGHPLMDELQQFKRTDNFRQKNKLSNKPIIALVPGSRTQEIAAMLPVMEEVAAFYPDYEFVIAGMNAIGKKYYEAISVKKNVQVIFNQTYDLLNSSSAALVTSGTATLETALFNVPQVVCYKTSPVSYWIGKQLVKIKYISLVNLIMDKPVVKELIQHDCTAELIKEELGKLLFDEQRINEIKLDYKLLREQLGGSGASERTAKGIIEYISIGKNLLK